MKPSTDPSFNQSNAIHQINCSNSSKQTSHFQSTIHSPSHTHSINLTNKPNLHVHVSGKLSSSCHEINHLDVKDATSDFWPI